MENSNTTNKKKNTWARIFGFLFIAALIAIAVIWFINENNLKKERENYQTQLTQITSQSQQMISENNERLLRLTMKPFAWAVRTEMMNENYEQVNVYVTEFVKEPNVESVSVIGPEGIILVSSNKKMEGSAANNFYPEFKMNNSSTDLSNSGGTIQISSPVMGLDTKLGTLIIRYNSPDLALNSMPNDTIQ